MKLLSCYEMVYRLTDAAYHRFLNDAAEDKPWNLEDYGSCIGCIELNVTDLTAEDAKMYVDHEQESRETLLKDQTVHINTVPPYQQHLRGVRRSGSNRHYRRTVTFSHNQDVAGIRYDIGTVKLHGKVVPVMKDAEHYPSEWFPINHTYLDTGTIVIPGFNK